MDLRNIGRKNRWDWVFAKYFIFLFSFDCCNNHVCKYGGNFVNEETGSEKLKEYSDDMKLVKELELETSSGPVELLLSQPCAACFSD